MQISRLQSYHLVKAHAIYIDERDDLLDVCDVAINVLGRSQEEGMNVDR